jgi:hypothetical protein
MLKWEWHENDRYGVNEWSATETEKWSYSIALKSDCDGNVSFLASRMSTNDGMSHEQIGDIDQECAALQDAKDAVARWHVERYADNDREFDEYGGNTWAREQFETAQWTGKFTCKSCGKAITDSYRIQGILHHGCDLKCEACAQSD